MINNSTTFEAVTSAMLRILKEDLHRADGTLEKYRSSWNRIEQFMGNHNLLSLTPEICDNFLFSIYGTKDLISLGGDDKKLVSSTLLLKNYLITGRIIPRKAPI